MHVVVNFDVGGLENGLVNLINGLPEESFRHAIVCLKGYTSFRNRLTRGDVELVALDKREGKDPAHYLSLWRLFRQKRPAIVHTRNLGTIDAVVPAKLAGVRNVVHSEHGWDVDDLHGTRKKYLYLRRAIAPLIDRHVAVSQDIATWLESAVRIRPDRITRIYNGVDIERFRPYPADQVAGEARGEPPVFVIGSVGRMADVKDPLNLARAFVRLVESADELRQRVRLVMVGDGPVRNDVQTLFSRAGLLDIVDLPGQRNDIPELLRTLDLFVLPSRNEGISNTILEAMATGVPVIATDVGGNPELIEENVTGALVPAEDPDALAEAIRRYVLDADTAKTHGAAGRARVCREFGMRNMLERYGMVYETLLGRSVAA